MSYMPTGTLVKGEVRLGHCGGVKLSHFPGSTFDILRDEDYSRGAFLVGGDSSPGNLATLQPQQNPLDASLRGVEVEDCGIFSPSVSPVLYPQPAGRGVVCYEAFPPEGCKETKSKGEKKDRRHRRSDERTRCRPICSSLRLSSFCRPIASSSGPTDACYPLA